MKNKDGRPRVFNEFIKPEKPVYTVQDAVKRKHQKPSKRANLAMVILYLVFQFFSFSAHVVMRN